MRRANLITLLLVCAAAAPVAGIAIWSISRTARELSDPCATWGYPPDQPMQLHVGPHDPCRAPSGHFESKASAAARAAIFPGGLLAATMLAVAGAALSRRWMILAAAVGMLIETFFVFTIAPLTLLVGLSFLFLASRVQAPSLI